MLLKQISYSAFHRITQALSSVVLVMLMLNLWGVDKYGIFAYYIAIATVLLSLAEFGTANVFKKHYTEAKAKKTTVVVSNIHVLRLAFIAPVASTFLVLWLFYESSFFLYYFLICCLLTFRLNEYGLEAKLQNNVIAKTKSLVYLVGLGAKSAAIVYGFDISAIAFISLIEHCCFVLTFRARINLEFTLSSICKRQIVSYLKIASTFALSYLITILGGKLYVLLIFNQLGDAETAVFAFSARIMELLQLPIQALAVVLLPLLLKNKSQSHSIYQNIMTASLIAYLLISLIFFFIQRPVLSLVIDNSADISNFIQYYVFICPLMAAYSLSNIFYIAKGENRLILVRSILFLLVSLISGLICIEYFSIFGVVISSIITYICVELMTLFYSKVGRYELMIRLSSIAGITRPTIVINQLRNIKHE